MVIMLCRWRRRQFALLELYSQGQLDVVGIREGEFVWVPTIGNQEG